mgnify:CR=1 FL=1
MFPDADRVETLLRAIVHEMRAEQLTFLAGSIAYHAFVSLLPLLLLLVLVLSALGDLAPTEAVLALIGAALTEGAADVLLSELRRASQSRQLSVFGGVVLVWGTLRVFRGLDTAFSDVYETEHNNGFFDQLFDGAMVFVVFALAVVVGATFHAAVPDDGAGTLWLVFNRLALVGGLTLTMLPMYYVFPDTDVTVKEVLPGTVVAAVGLTLFVSLFGLYVQWSGEQPEESVLAAILVFLTWLYVSGFVVLIGAVINAVLSNRSADVSVQPVFGGVSEGPARAPRELIEARIGSLERLFDDPQSFTVDTKDNSVSFPAPQSVAVDRGRSILSSGVTVEFRWSPAEADRLDFDELPVDAEWIEGDDTTWVRGGDETTANSGSAAGGEGGASEEATDGEQTSGDAHESNRAS